MYQSHGGLGVQDTDGNLRFVLPRDLADFEPLVDEASGDESTTAAAPTAGGAQQLVSKAAGKRKAAEREAYDPATSNHDMDAAGTAVDGQRDLPM